MESDHITKEDKETERIKKNALARVNTHPKRLEENEARRRDAVVFLEEDMRTFFNKECSNSPKRSPQNCPESGGKKMRKKNSSVLQCAPGEVKAHIQEKDARGNCSVSS